MTFTDDNHIYQWDKCLSFKGQKWIKTPAFFSCDLEMFDLKESAENQRLFQFWMSLL